MRSRGEEPASPRQDGNVDLIALFDLAEIVGYKVVELLIESIELLGPIQGDDGNATLIRERYSLVVRHVDFTTMVQI